MRHLHLKFILTCIREDCEALIKVRASPLIYCSLNSYNNKKRLKIWLIFSLENCNQNSPNSFNLIISIDLCFILRK